MIKIIIEINFSFTLISAVSISDVVVWFVTVGITRDLMTKVQIPKITPANLIIGICPLKLPPPVKNDLPATTFFRLLFKLSVTALTKSCFSM